MPRYRLTIEYDGRPYRGFQAQASLPSVQATIERAVTAFCGETIRLAAAGRTDTGVHATGQVVHIDLEKAWPAETVANALNAEFVDHSAGSSVRSCARRTPSRISNTSVARPPTAPKTSLTAVVMMAATSPTVDATDWAVS